MEERLEQTRRPRDKIHATIDDFCEQHCRLALLRSSAMISYSRSHDGVARIYDAVGNVIETHEDKGDFKEPWPLENTISDLLIKLAQAIQGNKRCEAGWNGRRSKQLTASCVCAGFRCSSSRSFF
jgi:hypothetical protein